MQRTLSGVIWLLLSCLGLAGCGTFSIPSIAVQGTTIVFPVPDGFGAGFGRALNQDLPYGVVDPASRVIDPAANPLLEDFQRGELLFALHTGPMLGSSLITYLPVRYITRVHADEATGAALPAAGESYINVGTPVQTGQIVAFVDVPYATPPGTWYVFIERWRRKPGASNQFEQMAPKMINFSTATLPWQGWAGWGGWGGYASSPDAPLKIRVVASTHASAIFHDTAWGFDKWNYDGTYAFLDYTEDLKHLVPNSKLRIWIGNPSTLEYPAAWEITLAYPAGKLEITGATLGRVHLSGGLVSVSNTGSPSDCGAPGTTRISLVDPDRRTQWVDVVFRLRDYAGCGRAAVGDFTLVPNSLKAYNVEGNPIQAIAYLDPEYSF